MKNQSIRSAATLFAFVGLLFSIACSPGTPTANKGNAGQPANAGNVQPAAADADRDNPCDKGTTQEKVDALNIRIDERFKDDKKFKEQWAPQTGIPTFRVWAVNNSGIIELKIKGKVSGKNDNGVSKLEGILDIIDGYLDKTSCIQKVIFVPGAITSANELAPTTSEGFEWVVCESNQVACPGGICMANPPGCSGIGANSNTGFNTNGTPPSNADPRPNSNTNKP